MDPSEIERLREKAREEARTGLLQGVLAGSWHKPGSGRCGQGLLQETNHCRG